MTIWLNSHFGDDQDVWSGVSVPSLDASGGKAREWLEACPVYQPTPLVEADGLANDLGIASLHLKQEAHRMGLGSFKALGGVFAILSQVMAGRSSVDISADDLKSLGAGQHFCCASAGNHGLSVAAGAQLVGAEATIFLDARVPETFADRLRGLGAQVQRNGEIYEESIAHAKVASEQEGMQLIADSSWDGYFDVPSAIMTGYTVLLHEIVDHQWPDTDAPSHIFLQGGVGGLAGAVAAAARLRWGLAPFIVFVEPDAASCLMESVKAEAPIAVTGPISNMGRLDCKEASLLALRIGKRDCNAFMTMTDGEATAAATLLGNAGSSSSPSGGAGYAGLHKAAHDNALRETLKLDHSSRVLCIVSEGAI